uniref:30S ribosomal protein S21 n=1 Tax=Phaeocystis antarctica TaxID=33657 RepID=A0A7S0HF89_9EUKA|mmetsp:Transcript_15611/g.36955  ORF Transcript_15611/g.36955 Transcript_15611/m.36955 type:complete len:119 (+) Transcript_15611:35-391(+)
MLRTLLLALGLASASALVMPASRPVATLARAGSPLMQQGPSDELHRKGHVVRIQIELEQGEPIEKALRRFRKSTNMVGHLRIIRNRKQFESNHDKKIRKAKESAMRGARERRNARKRF